MEARIIAQASAEGVSVDEYLQDLVSTSEEFVTAMRRLDASFDPLPREAVSAKITRGLEELARGEYVDGETFMDELLSEIENRRGPSPSG